MTDYLSLATSTSTQARVEATVLAIANESAAWLNDAVGLFNRNMGRCYANPDGLTPEQVVAGFGTAAVSLFQRSAALAAFILAQKPDAELMAVPDGLTITPNEDGTVTMTRGQ